MPDAPKAVTRSPVMVNAPAVDHFRALDAAEKMKAKGLY
jgi:hypothetical protein